MKVIEFKDKNSVTTQDVCDWFGDCLKERDIVKSAVIHETECGDILVCYSDMNFGDLLVLGATLQDFALEGMKRKI